MLYVLHFVIFLIILHVLLMYVLCFVFERLRSLRAFSQQVEKLLSKSSKIIFKYLQGHEI